MKKLLLIPVLSSFLWSATCSGTYNEYQYSLKKANEYKAKHNWKYVNININKAIDKLTLFQKYNCYSKVYKNKDQQFINQQKNSDRAILKSMKRLSEVSEKLSPQI